MKNCGNLLCVSSILLLEIATPLWTGGFCDRCHLLALHYSAQQGTAAQKRWVRINDRPGSYANARKAIEMQLLLKTRVVVHPGKETRHNASRKFGFLVNAKARTIRHERGHVGLTGTFQLAEHLVEFLREGWCAHGQGCRHGGILQLLSKELSIFAAFALCPVAGTAFISLFHDCFLVERRDQRLRLLVT